MNTHDIQNIIESALGASVVVVHGDGIHFDVTVVAQAFEGLSAVKRQQMVYALFAEAIQSGDIHALNLRLATPEENKT